MTELSRIGLAAWSHLRYPAAVRRDHRIGRLVALRDQVRGQGRHYLAHFGHPDILPWVEHA